MAIPTILRGDTPAPITLNIPADEAYRGALLTVSYQGAVRSYERIVPGTILFFSLTRVEVEKMSLGTHPVTMRCILIDGSERTIPSGDARIRVTDCPGEVYDGEIHAGAISGDYNELTNKPTLNGVVIEGNKTSRDYHIEGGGGGSVVESETNPGYAANADTAGVALRACHADTAGSATSAQEASVAISALSATQAGYAGSAPWSGITGKPSEFAPTRHASSHAANGVDEIKPSDIGALAIVYNEASDETEVYATTRGGERTTFRISSNTGGESILRVGNLADERGSLFVGTSGDGVLRVGHEGSEMASVEVAGVEADAKVRLYKDEETGEGRIQKNGMEVATENQLAVVMDLVEVSGGYEVRLGGVAQTFADIKALAETRNAVIRHGRGTYRVTYIGSAEMMWDCTGTVQGEVQTGMIHIFAAGNVVQLIPAKTLAEQSAVDAVDAKAAYPMREVTDGNLADRAINYAASGGTFMFPVRTGANARDFVLVIDALATAPTVTFPGTVTYVSDQDAADIWTADANKFNAWYFSEQTDGVFMVSHKAMSVVAQ